MHPWKVGEYGDSRIRAVPNIRGLCHVEKFDPPLYEDHESLVGARVRRSLVIRNVITNNAMEAQGMSREVEKCLATHDQRHATNRELLGGDR